MRAIVAGADEEGIADALNRAGVTVTEIEGITTRERLVEAGMAEADLFVLTDVKQPTAVPMAAELNENARMVVYDRLSLPEVLSRVTDLAVDPGLLGPDTVAEELVNGTG